MTECIWSSVVGDLFSIQLTGCGILISIFTLVYSLIYGKINELKIISDDIKQGNQSPVSLQREKFCHTYIAKYTSINAYVIVFGIISLLLCVTAFLLKYITIPRFWKWIFVSINIVDIILILIGLFRFLLIYRSSSKFN